MNWTPKLIKIFHKKPNSTKKYLIDTHLLIWSIYNDSRLPKKAYDILNNRENELFYSAASPWEVGIKHDKKPQEMPIKADDIVEGCRISGIKPLPITELHAQKSTQLRRRNGSPAHNDPFDRIMIAQANVEGMELLTHDHLLKDYINSNIKTV